MKNASLFRLRQWFTAYGKENLQPLQEEVVREAELTCRTYSLKKPGKVLSYKFLEKLMRATKNPDFFAGLPMQCAQQAIRESVRDFKNWLDALRTWSKMPSAFTGKPQMPKYLRKNETTVCMINQDCEIKREDNRCFLKLPLTKETIDLHVPEDAVLKELQIKPYYGKYQIILVYETAAEETYPGFTPLYSAALDLGVDNLAAFVSNDGKEPLIYKGEVIKAENQWFNRQKAKYTGFLTKGHDPKTVRKESKRLSSFSRNRANFMRDNLHKISSHIVRECLSRNIGILYIGKNTQWKSESNMGKMNNQAFISIPHSILIKMIEYKGERAGIQVIEQEESYTSKASFLDNDFIPVYGKEEGIPSFSGRRIKRGLYRSGKGIILNADVQGAANILRKADPNAFAKLKDFSFLQEARTVHFRDYHPVCNTVSEEKYSHNGSGRER